MQVFHYDGLSLQNKRSTNMDCILLKERVVSGEKVCLSVVCDGVGSLTNGAFAASYAVKRLIQWLDFLSSTQRIGLQLLEEVADINHAVLSEAKAGNLRTASTLSALLLAEDKYYIVHVGDSRIYSVQDGSLVQLTEDQINGGKLTSFLGFPGRLPIFYKENDYTNQIFLLCSDGLYKRMDEAFFQKQLSRLDKRNIHHVLELLTQSVMKRGELDNISAAVVMCER